MKLRMNWCTRDWCGGANYGPYSLRSARRIVAKTAHLNPYDRQALTFAIHWDSGDGVHGTEWTVDINERRLRRYRWDIRDRIGR